MKSTLVSIALVCFAVTGSTLFGASVGLGEKVGDFQLQDTSGAMHSLSSYSGRIVVLAFWSFKCPTALAYDDRLAALEAKFSSRGVAVLAVASNVNESRAELERNAANLKLSFPVLLDSEGLLADRLGATLTPSVFILDRSGVLRYRGAVDNRERVGDRRREAYAEDAIESILAGKAVANPETQAAGCSIKRKP